MTVMSQSPINADNADNNDDHYESLVERQNKAEKNYYTLFP